MNWYWPKGEEKAASPDLRAGREPRERLQHHRRLKRLGYQRDETGYLRYWAKERHPSWSPHWADDNRQPIGSPSRSFWVRVERTKVSQLPPQRVVLANGQSAAWETPPSRGSVANVSFWWGSSWGWWWWRGRWGWFLRIPQWKLHRRIVLTLIWPLSAGENPAGVMEMHRGGSELPAT